MAIECSFARPAAPAPAGRHLPSNAQGDYSMSRRLLPFAALAALAVHAPAHAQSADPARDHAAILKIAGEYAVDFAFDETVLLQPGYERAPAMRAGADEAVVVVEDTPTRVVLQHLLVDAKSGHVTKHWREDWE